jgi:hypothetical protein
MVKTGRVGRIGQISKTGLRLYDCFVNCIFVPVQIHNVLFYENKFCQVAGRMFVVVTIYKLSRHFKTGEMMFLKMGHPRLRLNFLLLDTSR